MDNKAIYDKHYTRLYYFAYHYLKDKDKASDFVIAAFKALFSVDVPDDEDAVKQFLYRHIALACINYYITNLGIPPPDKADFINTRLDAEYLYLIYKETA